MAIKVKKSKITTWKPKESQIFVERDGKIFICNFDKIFGHKEKFQKYNKFMIKKDSYINQLDTITKYINFFMNNYDPDMELASAYLDIKFSLDKNREWTEDNMDAYIDFLYERLFTPRIVENIRLLVEENYLDDIESNIDDKKKYAKNEKKHLESLEFTNMHIKILLMISFGMKIMSPCIFHYIQLNNIKLPKDTMIIYNFYARLFKIFGYSNEWIIEDQDNPNIRYQEYITEEQAQEYIKKYNLTPVSLDTDILYNHSGPMELKNVKVLLDESEETFEVVDKDIDANITLRKEPINMYNKLYVYVKAKVGDSNSNNLLIFSQREIFGIDLFTVINHFTKKVLISENMVKYLFNEHWDEKQHKYKENIVGFNKTIVKFQLSYFLKEQYSKTITEVTGYKNADGLSGADKLLMNSVKIDEGVTAMADMNIKFTMEKIKKMIDIPINDDEVEYYMKNHIPNKLEIMLINAYYSKYFYNYRDLNLITRRQYMTLLILLKKKLLIELGYEEDKNGSIHYASLPFILTGNLIDRVNTRMIRSNKFMVKLDDNELYNHLITSKYRMLEEIRPGYIKQIISSLLNTRFSYVTYEAPDLLDQEIFYPEDKVCNEILIFLDSI